MGGRASVGKAKYQFTGRHEQICMLIGGGGNELGEWLCRG